MGAGDRGAPGPKQPDGIIPASVWLEGGSSSRRLGESCLHPGWNVAGASDSVTLHPQNPMSLQAAHIITPPEVRRLWGIRASLGISSGPTIVPRAKRRCFLGNLSNEVLGKGMDTLRFCLSRSSQGLSPPTLHGLTLPLQVAQGETQVLTPHPSTQ